MLELETQIKDFMTLNNEGKWKLAKKKKVQDLEANVHKLEGKLEVEKRQWIELNDKHMDLLDRVMLLDN
jgi:hypothetical protein